MKLSNIAGFTFALLLLLLSSPRDLQAAKGGLAGPGGLNFNPAGDSENNLCLGGFNEDVNELLGVNEQVIWDACPQVNSGEFYVALSGFLVNAPDLQRCCSNPCDPQFVSNCDPADCNPDGDPFNPENPCYVYPSDYDPNGLSPAEDLIAKMDFIRFIVDHETVYEYPAEDIGKNIENPPFDPLPSHWELVEWPAKLPPLPPGPHSLEIFYVFADRFADGICLIPEGCVFEPGAYLLWSWNFEVSPGASQSKARAH